YIERLSSKSSTTSTSGIARFGASFDGLLAAAGASVRGVLEVIGNISSAPPAVTRMHRLPRGRCGNRAARLAPSRFSRWGGSPFLVGSPSALIFPARSARPGCFRSVRRRLPATKGHGRVAAPRHGSGPTAEAWSEGALTLPIAGDSERLVRARGAMFLVTTHQGDVTPAGARELGLFYKDTRFLSHYELEVVSCRTVSLGA